jgi:RNA polymerase subunit RPABC4/transcription elongation factor Spt4
MSDHVVEEWSGLTVINASSGSEVGGDAELALSEEDREILPEAELGT